MTDSKSSATNGKAKKPDERSEEERRASRHAVSFGDVVPLEADEKWVPGDPFANPPTPGYVIRPDGTTRPALRGKAGVEALAALNAAKSREAPQVAATEQPAGVVRWKRVGSALRPLGADGASVGKDVAYPTIHAARSARRKLNGEAKPMKG